MPWWHQDLQAAKSLVLMPFVFCKKICCQNHMPVWEKAASSAAPQKSTQYRQIVVIERDVDQIDVKDLPLYEIPDNDIRLAAGRQGIFRA